VPGAEALKSVHLGWDFACGLFDDATVRCWGEGKLGRLGDSSLEEGIRGLTSPLGDRRALAIAGSESGTCAELGDATVWCWGLF
jgi:hypothetical protein